MSSSVGLEWLLSLCCCAGKESGDQGVALFLRVAELEDVMASGGHELCVMGVRPDEAEQELEEKRLKVSLRTPDLDLGSELVSAGMVVNCRCGRHPGVANRDTFLLCRVGALTVLGIADGFGDTGDWAADWVVRYTLASLLAELKGLGRMPQESYLRELFATVRRALKLRSVKDGVELCASGSTFSLVLVDHDKRSVTCAWAGDSKCVLGELLPGMSGRATLSGSTHRACVREVREVARVPSEGGGPDSPAAASPTPELWRESPAAQGLGGSTGPATKSMACSGTDAFVVCCTDIVWRQVETQEVLNVVGKAGPRGVCDASEELVQLAQARTVEALATGDETYEDLTVAIIWV